MQLWMMLRSGIALTTRHIKLVITVEILTSEQQFALGLTPISILRLLLRLHLFASLHLRVFLVLLCKVIAVRP